MAKQTVRDLDVKGKRVLVRVDFNVPIKDGKITNDNRIVSALPTINYLTEHGAKVILMSHLGKIDHKDPEKCEAGKKKNNMAPVAARLQELVSGKVTFVPVTRGEELENAIAAMNEGDIVLMQNTRYEKGESKNDPDLAAYWAGLGDLFVSDAFGSVHRAHASTVGIATHLPSACGFLVQKEIENLQRRIDQLQWELDNADTVRLQNNVGDAVQRLRDIYAETTQEVLRLHLTSQQYGNAWTRMFARMRYDSEVYEKSVEKIADAYAKVAYTADKALGGKKYDESRKQLENLAEQQILIQKQINEEQSKKKTDHGKIAEWENQIREIAQEMAAIINEMLEDIIGYTAADLASELGDAFFEAAKQGEDAMEAWRKKVNDIVADVLQRMLVQKYLEERIGGIFDRYKKEWFGNDGTFKGIDAVIGSMNGFAGELNQVGEEFNAIYQGLSDSLKNYFTGDAEREGTSKGIATASQDSVDENNARLTTIQGHTYTLVQGMNDLNRTSNAVLDKLTGIEKNTSDANDKLDRVDKNIKDIKNTVDDIDRKGLKLRS